MLARLLPDRFALWLLAAVALAVVLPVRGLAAEAVDFLTLAAILLFLPLLAIVPAATWLLGRPFPRESRTAILFCGSVKPLRAARRWRGSCSPAPPPAWSSCRSWCSTRSS